MFFPTIATFVAITFIAINGEENCDLLGRNFYEKLNCAPKHKPGSDCPVAYNCPKFEVGPDYCIFQNVHYKIGEDIQNASYCNVACYCDEYRGVDNPITCAAVDCAWNTPEELENCYETRTPAGCCPLDKICEPYDDIPKCELDGKTYMEGQLMDTGDTCWLCVCKKGFRGVFEEPYCIKEPCDMEIHYSKQLADKCAPIYRNWDSKKSLCCPRSFLCPDAVMDFKIIKSEKKHCGKEQCTFMDKQLNINDKFVATYEEDSNVKNVTCSCLLPPYVACS